MASLRKLSRRLRRWDRYAARYGHPPARKVALSWDLPFNGQWRAYWAWQDERDRHLTEPFWPAVVDLPVDRRLL